MGWGGGGGTKVFVMSRSYDQDGRNARIVRKNILVQN